MICKFGVFCTWSWVTKRYVTCRVTRDEKTQLHVQNTQKLQIITQLHVQKTQNLQNVTLNSMYGKHKFLRFVLENTSFCALCCTLFFFEKTFFSKRICQFLFFLKKNLFFLKLCFFSKRICQFFCLVNFLSLVSTGNDSACPCRKQSIDT